MHKKNAIEFVTLLGFFFFVCVNHERCSVSGVAFLSFLSFGLTLINVCTTCVLSNVKRRAIISN